MIFKGFRFGMLLQLAVGPMCLLVFNTAAKFGFWNGLLIVFAITIIDLLYIILAGLGIGAIINKETIKTSVKIFGALVLMLFGGNMIAEVFHISLLPDIKLFAGADHKNIFIQGLLLTASNPLTIIFWGGVFSTQVIENKYNKIQLRYFGLGCILSTLCFLSLIAGIGALIGVFLSEIIIQILNIGVGCIIIYFGIRLLISKAKKECI